MRNPAAVADKTAHNAIGHCPRPDAKLLGQKPNA
jgi:hypothetical protein